MPQRHPMALFIWANKTLADSLDDFKKQKYKISKLKLQQMLSVTPNYANALLIYSTCLENLGEKQKSQKYLKRVEQLNPYIYKYYQQRPNKVRTDIESLCTSINKYFSKANSDYENISWLNLLNDIHNKKDMNLSNIVFDFYNQFEKNKDKNPKNISSLGIHAYEAGRYEQSLKDYELAILGEPDQYRYYNNAGILAYVLGQYERSQQFAVIGLQKKPGYAKSYFVLSFALMKLGKYQQSLQNIKKSVLSTPNSTMYTLKLISLLLLHFPQKIDQAKMQISRIYQVIKKSEDKQSYFFNEDNKYLLQTATLFLKENIELCQNEKMKDYIRELDDFLIKGHMDKARINKKMKLMKQNLVKQFNIQEEIASSDLFKIEIPKTNSLWIQQRVL